MEIWRGKRARCLHSNLILHKQVGGAGLVDVCDYRWAVKLEQLKWWFSDDNVPLWMEVEKSLAPTNDLKAFFIGELWKPWDTWDYPLSIQVFIQPWRFLNTHCKTNPLKVEYQISLSLLEIKIPTLSTKLYPAYGITTIQDFQINSRPKSVERLIAEYDMPRILHFQVLVYCTS